MTKIDNLKADEQVLLRLMGIERERYIVDPKTGIINPKTGLLIPSTCKIVSRIGDLLPLVHEIAIAKGIPKERFTYEGYAGQIEDLTDPCETEAELGQQIKENDTILNEAAKELGLAYDFTEYIDDLSRCENLDCNPFSDRAAAQWRTLPIEVLNTACRTIGTHINIETTRDETVGIFNSPNEIIDDLCKLGDHSGLKRVNAWKTVKKVPDWKIVSRDPYPPTVTSYEEILEYNAAAGGHKNIYDLIRHKPSLGKDGVTELRMLGATGDVSEIENYSRVIKKRYGLGDVYGRRSA